MKVLILANHDLVVYNFRKELVEKLIDLGYEVIICSPYGPRINKLINIGAKYEHLNFDRHGVNPLKEYKLLQDYKTVVKNTNPNIILSYTIKPNLYGSISARKFAVPIIVNITGLGDGINNKGIKEQLLLCLYKFAFKSTEKIFFQNTKDFEYLTSLIPIKSKSDMLPGSGVNLKEFSFHPLPKNNTLIILYFGRIMESKGIPEYLKAIVRLNQTHKNVEYHFVGFFENNKIKELFNKFKEQNENIKYFEHVDNIIPYLINSDVIILPSHHEGMSNALLEAAAIGRPLLASNIHGCKEIIDDGKNGFLFEVKNFDAIFNAINKYLKLSYEERVEMGIYSRKIVEKKFNRYIVLN